MTSENKQTPLAPTGQGKKRPPVNRLKPMLLWVGLLGCIAATIIAFQAWSFLNTPVRPDSTTTRFIIASGESLTRIAENLKESDLISSAFFFSLYARHQNAAGSLQTGEYLFTNAHTPEEILFILRKGKVKLYRITLPEGLNMEETADVVARSGFCPREAFLALCRDADYIETLKVPSHTLEGFLYPDTYFFPVTAGCKDIISTMVTSFNRVFTEKWKERARELKFSVQDVVTLASIIEKETGKAFERPIISSVFHNRLERKMKLQSDPTVIYGDKDFRGRIRTRHLRRKTPYNTYVIKGLPLGPIANPGSAALEAALYPDRTDYIFFVSKNDRTHLFSKTLKEHNQAVRKYQLKK